MTSSPVTIVSLLDGAKLKPPRLTAPVDDVDALEPSGPPAGAPPPNAAGNPNGTAYRTFFSRNTPPISTAPKIAQVVSGTPATASDPSRPMLPARISASSGM